MRVRHRLLLIMCVGGLLGAAMVAVGAVTLLRSAVRGRTVERVHAETALLAQWVEQSTEDPQAFSERAASRLGTRVTLVAPDGTVLGDSARTREGLLEMENHIDRPEIRAARLRGSGESLRLSGTTNVVYFYVAERVPGDGPVRYVRLALPAHTVRGVEADYVRLIVLVVAGAMLLLIALGYLAVRRLSRPMEKISTAVERSASGDYRSAVPIPRDGGQEVIALATSVRRLQVALLENIEELEDERTLLASVVAGMREGLLLVDSERRVRLANGALRRILDVGFDPTGHLLEEVVRHPTVVQDLDAALNEGRETRESVVRVPGSDRTFELHAAPLEASKKSGGRGVLALFVDVTRLDRLEKVRREFVANVSHELRTPLTSIKAFVENLLDGGIEDGANARRFLEIVNRHADHMGELVNDLTDLSLIETGAIALELREVDASEVTREVVEQLRPLARSRRVSVQVQLPAPLSVRADRRRLEQMLTNLVNNAIKFNRPGGSVVIDGKTGTDETWISVRDTGIGIPSSSLEKVFERFYQVSRDRSRDVGGTGLGLSIVKHLMRLHGGLVVLESELGRGSTFTLKFPTADDDHRVVRLSTIAG